MFDENNLKTIVSKAIQKANLKAIELGD
nr:hypothetical protein [Flavobacterium davisii]